MERDEEEASSCSNALGCLKEQQFTHIPLT